LDRAAIMRLAKAGIFGSLETDRRHALWDALAQDQRPMPLLDAAALNDTDNRQPTTDNFLPAMTPAEEVLADYRTTGLSLLAHPLQFLRGELEKLRVVPAAGLKTWPNGKWVRVAGLVLGPRRPRASPSSPWKTRPRRPT
jgi:error-prone DNA polymerase